MRLKVIQSYRLSSQGARIALALLVAVIFSTYWLTTTKTARRSEPVKSPILVDTVQANIVNQQLNFTRHGTIVPAKEIVLRPQVNGQVIWQSEKLIPGGRFLVGEEMLKIDRRDYENIVEQRRAALADTALALQQEEGRVKVAAHEWKLLGEEIKTTELGRDLALRQAHLRRARAALKAAESNLKQAELDLSRTVIHAPFNSLILREGVDIGKLLSPQTEIATLAGTDRFWVEVSLPLGQLSWLRFPQEEGQEGHERGSTALVIQGGENASRVVREGYVLLLKGEIRPETRMATVVVAVDDPLALESSSQQELPLLVGAWVSVEFRGEELQGVTLLPRAALREGNRLWVINKEGLLEFRPVEHLHSLPDGRIIIRGELQEGEEVIISRINAPIPGMLVHSIQRQQEKEKRGES